MNLPDIDAVIRGAKDRWDDEKPPINAVDQDVRDLIRVAEAMRAYIAGIHGADLDDPMPVFVLKAKDRLAQSGIGAYLDACDEAGLPRQAGSVLWAMDEFTAWQERHPDRMKLPDHEHVPVGDALRDIEGPFHGADR